MRGRDDTRGSGGTRPIYAIYGGVRHNAIAAGGRGPPGGGWSDGKPFHRRLRAGAARRERARRPC